MPLCLTFVIQMIIIIVDSLFAGNISYVDLAAVSLGGSAYYIFLLLLVGFEVGSSIRGGQAIGSGDEDGMMRVFRLGIMLCLVFGFAFSLVLLNGSPILLVLGQKPDVVALFESYMYWFAWTLPIQLLVIIFRGYFAVIDRPWASVWPVMFSLGLNAFLNYCFAYGNFGFPEMGIAGIGLASLVSNIVLLGMMLKNVGSEKTKYLFDFFRLDAWTDSELVKLFVISLPIGLTLVMEEAFFSGTNFLAGKLGAAEQAAHQILFNAVGTSYLFNTGIAMAVSIIVGKYIGAKNYSQILPVVKSGIVITLVCTLPFALILGLFGDQWIFVFLDESLDSNSATIIFAKSIMYIAVIILFVDAGYMMFIESLHGMLDTTYPAVCTLIGYWIIAGPIALWAAHNASTPFTWIWLCILFSSCLLMFLVGFRLRSKIREYSNLNLKNRTDIC